MEDLLELLKDAMKYMVIEERLMEPQRKKCEDAKRTKLDCYIANINPECQIQYKARRPFDCIHPYLITNTSVNSGST